MEDLVSIIIPVYNVYDYLDRCLSSMINQTYKNIEIILINDGSTDDSDIKCEQWAKKDNRIIYFSKENEGLAPTRNFAISIAKGEYIMYTDPDDWVELDFVETMYHEIKRTGAEMAFCDYFHEVWDEDGKDFNRRWAKKYLTFDGITNANDSPELYAMSAISWNKMIIKEKANILQHGKIAEDLMWWVQLLKNVEKIIYVKKPLYHYWINRGDSLINSAFDINKNLKFMEIPKFFLSENIINFKQKVFFKNRLASIFSLSLKRLKDDAQLEKTAEEAKDKFYQMFPKIEQFDKLKILFLGSENLDVISHQIKYIAMDHVEIIRLKSPLYHAWESTNQQLADIKFENYDYIVIDMIDYGKDLEKTYRENIENFKSYISKNLQHKKIYFVNSKFALGSGIYSLEKICENSEEIVEQNRILEESTNRLNVSDTMQVIGFDHERYLFCEDVHTLPLNSKPIPLNYYWYNEISNQIKLVLF